MLRRLWLACGVAVACSGDHPLRVLSDSLDPKPKRASTRVSLAYFGHLSDLHLTDEMSPLRAEFVDPAHVGDWAYMSASRPQEALSLYAVDRSIRVLNTRMRSTVRQADGQTAELSFALVTGDLIDNMQHNELSWAVQILGGERADPFSGQAIGKSEACPGASPSQGRELDERVAARRYSGVQSYALYPPGVPVDRMVSFYDPDRAAPESPRPVLPRYTIPRYPGLMDRAQQAFDAEGIAVPYFVARGNHGALAQGHYPPFVLQSLYQIRERGLEVTGCRKVFPNEALDPYDAPWDEGPLSPERTEAIVANMQEMYGRSHEQAIGRFVPPDVRRRYLESPEFAAAFASAPDAAGYGFVDPAEREASNGYAHYYAWSPAPGLRFVSIDTNAEGGGPDGNLDDPQFRWLAEELASTPPDTLVVVFAHHTIETLNNPAPNCPEAMPHCDGDPRPSEPIHLGCPTVGGKLDCAAPHERSDEGPDNLRDLLLDHPNAILYVTGHTHRNRIEPYSTSGGTGFWQVTTASIVEWPQQTRTLELMDNRDGTLSVFATLVDGFAGLRAPAGGRDAEHFSHEEAVAAGRELALGDVQWRDNEGRTADGRHRDGVNIDGDVELMLPDPRSAR